MALGLLAPDDAARVLQLMSPQAAANALAAMSEDALGEVAAGLPVDVFAILLRRLAAPAAERALAASPRAQADGARRLLASIAGTAGALMDPLAATIAVDATVAECRRVVPLESRAECIWVIDDRHALVGVVIGSDLATATETDRVGAIMRQAPAAVPSHLPIATLVGLPEWQQTDVLPVADASHRFTGELRHRQLRQAQARQRTGTGADQTVRTLMALGEVYWLGLSGLMQGLATSAVHQAAPSPEGGAR
jgi:Mg/Co/Ni transporter MgtE